MKIMMLFLTCVDIHEARAIIDALLSKKLIACAKTVPVTAEFVWQSSVDSADEIFLIMETIESNFDRIEQEVRKLHSYKTFVLMGIEVVRSSFGVENWIKSLLVSKHSNENKDYVSR